MGTGSQTLMNKPQRKRGQVLFLEASICVCVWGEGG